jgi:hypothetical protein
MKFAPTVASRACLLREFSFHFAFSACSLPEQQINSITGRVTSKKTAPVSFLESALHAPFAV